jgi:hypothetical protein
LHTFYFTLKRIETRSSPKIKDHCQFDHGDPHPNDGHHQLAHRNDGAPPKVIQINAPVKRQRVPKMANRSDGYRQWRISSVSLLSPCSFYPSCLLVAALVLCHMIIAI